MYRFVMDLPQLYTKPSAATLISTLNRLVKISSWDDALINDGLSTGSPNEDGLSNDSPINENGLPNYLTGIIASKLTWIEEEVREQIWELASARLSERSGRSGLFLIHPSNLANIPAIPSLSRIYNLESVSITLHEPSLTADNLGHKTWLSSFLLAKRISSLHLPALQSHTNQPSHVIELGAGTGLVGLTIATLFPVHVHLTDLPDIIPNLRSNVTSQGSVKGTTTVGELDWSKSVDNQVYDLVVAADPIYSPQHPIWLVNTIEGVLKRDTKARVVIELPLREVYKMEVEELKNRMVKLGLEIISEGLEYGVEDWESAQERTRVECWWAVWGWSCHSNENIDI